ncbi:MAG: hypothetical protein Q4F45_05030 [Alistipes sp.]|nr:hypothetical protein [Alistipes sp.]
METSIFKCTYSFNQYDWYSATMVIEDDKIIIKAAKLYNFLFFWNKPKDIIINLSEIKGYEKKKLSSYAFIGTNGKTLIYIRLYDDSILETIEDKWTSYHQKHSTTTPKFTKI